MKSLFFIFLLLSSTKVLAVCDLNLKSQAEASRYNYIIVPGILNEAMSFYMTEYRRQLMDLGVPASQIKRINMPSFRNPEWNLNYIQNTIDQFSNGKKIVFFAHSKGALETLYYLNVHHKSFPFEKAFLIQGSLDGSSSYRMIVENKHKTKLFSFLRSVSKYRYIKEFSEAFASSSVRERLAGIAQDKVLVDKLTFIESEIEFKKLSYQFWILGWFYKKAFKSAGDGVLLRADHIPYELKGGDSICRKFYEIHHGELVKAAPWDSSGVQKIRSFMSEALFGFKRDE